MFDQLGPAPRILPEYLVGTLNLITVLLWYVAIAFAVSLLLRLRFYWSIYRISKYFAVSCPNVFRLLQQHILHFVQNGVILLVTVYGAILIVYFGVTRFVFPDCRLTIQDLAAHPPVLAMLALASGVVLALDIVLILQIGVIDVGIVESELKFAEYWLGSKINHFLGRIFGRWNPVRLYADAQTRAVLKDFNGIFRNNLALMICQLSLRMLLIAGIFWTYVSLHRA